MINYKSCFVLFWSPQTNTENLSVSTGHTIMAPSIQVFLQVAVLCCVVTTSIGGIADFQKAFSDLQNEVKEIRQQSQEEIKSLQNEVKEIRQQSQEEIKSLHQKIEQLEKRLGPLVTKGWFRFNFE